MVAITQATPTALVITPKEGVKLTPDTAQAALPAEGSVFGAMLDAINPLQHIPVVSNIFRAATGSSISSISQVAGDTLYGGLVGGALSSLISSVADVAVKEASGKNITEHVLDTLNDTGSSSTTKAQGTPLVPNPDAVPPAQEANSQTPAPDLRSILKHDKIAAQYQRVQALDVSNKLLTAL